MTVEPQSFNSLDIPIMSYVNNKENTYLIYSDAKNFVSIEANSANEAIEKSGINIPFMIKHESNENKNIMSRDELTKTSNLPAAPTEN